MKVKKHYTDTLIMPAEWYPQSGVQLTWPHARTDWKPYLAEINKVFIELTRAIAHREIVLIVTPNSDEIKELLIQKMGIELLRNVRFHQCETNDTWARDHAAITLVHRDTNRAFSLKKCLLNFRFNGWGEKFAADKDNEITHSIYRNNVLNANMENHTDFVLEGGAIESDGEGTVFTTSQCMLAPHRNQPLERTDIEQRLKTTLRAERIVWIEHGQLIGDDTDGHIDTIVRTAPNQTLVYVGCEDKHDEQYEDFKALEQQLKTLTTIDGKPYKLLKLPMPYAIFDCNERLPATYANYLIINGAVICPTYGQPENDKTAQHIIAKAYPNHDIIPIDARTVIRQHGSLHCLTMQYPQDVLSTNL